MASRINSCLRRRDAFTLVEMVLVAALTGAILIMMALWMKSGSLALRGAISDYQIHQEAVTVADLLGKLLRGANPLSIHLSSTADNPWSSLSFATGPSHYTFSASEGRLLFVRDHSEPKVLTSHLVSFHVAMERNNLPTLLYWNLRLARDSRSGDAMFSGVQYIPDPVE